MLNCEFYDGVYWDNVALRMKPVDNSIKTDKNWVFSKFSCFDTSTSSTSTLPEYIEKQNDNFFLQKTFSLGEIIFLAVLIPAIFVFLLVKIREFLKNKYQ